MIPRVAIRGHSFIGAGAYYLHDKKKDTSERVGWVETHNLPTRDGEKAMKVMAFTAMNADQIKRNAGVPLTGRKPKTGDCYSFSLAWNPEQNPDKEEMMTASFNTLEKLGLQEHQSVMVYHQETDHPHVHVICNLVNPDTGKRAKLYNDYLVFSEWAEAKELEDGKVYCEERVINNKVRRGEDLSPHQKSIREEQKTKRTERKELVDALYKHSDSGKAFASALKMNGYILAEGDRRGYVVVDDQGDIYSLSRMLKGVKALDLKNRLATCENIGMAKVVSDDIKYSDPDKSEIDQQIKLEQDALEYANNKHLKDSFKADTAKRNVVDNSNAIRANVIRQLESNKLFQMLEFERKQSNNLIKANDEYFDALQISQSEDTLAELIKERNELRGMFTKRRKEELERQISDVEREIKESNTRLDSQLSAFKLKLKEDKDLYMGQFENVDIDEKVREIQLLRQRELDDAMKKSREHNKPDNDKSMDIEP